MPLKAVYDWTVFLKAEQRNVDWSKERQMLEECRLDVFFDLVTELCVKYLGLMQNVDVRRKCVSNPMLEKAFMDILERPLVLSQKSLCYKIFRIMNRLHRMTTYRKLLGDQYWFDIRNLFFYRSIMNRKVSLDE